MDLQPVGHWYKTPKKDAKSAARPETTKHGKFGDTEIEHGHSLHEHVQKNTTTCY